MTGFDILLFAPHLPAQGKKARAHFTSSHLEIEGQAVDAPLESIGVTLGGLDHKQLYLFWHQEEGRWAISPQDTEAQEALIKAAPAPVNTLLKNASRDIRQQGHRFRMVLILLALAAIIAILLAGILFWQSDRIAGLAANHVSLEQQKRFSEQPYDWSKVAKRV
ncbi:MAG: hypothetical protein WBX11_13550 [Thiobacillaceae bacterium]